MPIFKGIIYLGINIPIMYESEEKRFQKSKTKLDD